MVIEGYTWLYMVIGGIHVLVISPSRVMLLIYKPDTQGRV